MTKDRFNTEIIPGAIYQHYKGKQYRVIGLGKHSETLEDLVMYECLYESPLGRLWCRPAAMWSEPVDVDGNIVPRFKLLFK